MKKDPPASCGRPRPMSGWLLARASAVIIMFSALSSLWEGCRMALSPWHFTDWGGGPIPSLWALPRFAVAVVLIGVAASVFRFTSSRPGRPSTASPGLVLVTCVALPLGLLLLLIMGGCLLAAVVPESREMFPDPKHAPWLSFLAVVVLAPAVTFWRVIIDSANVAPGLRTALKTVECLIGVLALPCCIAGLVAAAVPEMREGVGVWAALQLSGCALALFLLFAGPVLGDLWRQLRERHPPPPDGHSVI